MIFQHGGQLDRIKKEYPKQTLPWVDLSTGINPFAYPVANAIERQLQTSLQSLPQKQTQMTNAAAAYYRSENILVIPGSMWAIQILPLIRRQCRADDPRPVLIPRDGFTEHAKAWREWGYITDCYDGSPSLNQLKNCQACVVINPNNPTGYMNEKSALEAMHQILHDNGAWLVVDEAFLDLSPELSLSSVKDKADLVILKSFGKFFGLPGLRVGAVISDNEINRYLNKLLNPWSINSTTQEIVTEAWLDEIWQASVKIKIQTMAKRLKDVLKSVGIKTSGTDFYQTLLIKDAGVLYEYLLSQGIYVRLLDNNHGVRFGLPKSESDCNRLKNALADYTNKHDVIAV